MSGRLVWTAVLLVVLASACGGPSEHEAPDQGDAVEFRSLDGVALEGRSFGEGRTAVVLSHMGRGGDSQVDWFPVARELAAAGFRALTYNRRGVCSGTADGCSKGVDDLSQSWKDVVGGYRYARDEGASRVVLVGASIGAMSSLFAAARADVGVAGVVEVGGINDASGYSFSRSDIQAVEGAKLFVSSQGDVYGGAEAARQWHRWARAPKDLVILAGSDHGTDLLRAGNPARGRLIDLIVEFVRGLEP